WFYQVVIPQYLITDERLTRDGSGWVARALVRNVGTGRMPVEVAAARGERFPHGGGAHVAYADARTTLTLGAGEARAVEIRCAFQPERLLVDPDVRVMQLERNKAVVPLHPAGGRTLAASPASRRGAGVS
ncbi:MAG TPA: hypothetical protein VGU27_03480, partial [Candidatus Eisenbacteria bacterium]|nr:hypothetical protein [Candidatus Eisenbacteria bacterium]